ncbi:MAG: signal peptidase II [Lachnospiraceae bacterium]|nr:signal peptidase II [Lachnospiraceae bacterium]
MNSDNKKTNINCPVVGGILFFLLLALDLYTKNLAYIHLRGAKDLILIPGVFQLRYLENTGAAFSLLTGKISFFYVITVILSAIILWALIKIPKEPRYYPLFFTLIVLFSGAMGNFFDRITHRYVIDFLYFSLINFPVFNVADIYVTCSVVVLFILFMFVYKDEELTVIFKRKHKDEPSDH